jgi:hypothetical protein
MAVRKYTCLLRYDDDFDNTWTFARSVIKEKLGKLRDQSPHHVWTKILR